MTDTTADPTRESIETALAEHADRLVPHASPQLAAMWADELKGSSPAVIRDVVAARLSGDNPQWAHFRRYAATPTPAGNAPAPAYGGHAFAGLDGNGALKAGATADQALLAHAVKGAESVSSNPYAFNRPRQRVN